MVYRARGAAIRARALELGADGSMTSIAKTAGVPFETMRRALLGVGWPSSQFMAAVAYNLKAPTDELFEIVDSYDARNTIHRGRR